MKYTNSKDLLTLDIFYPGKKSYYKNIPGSLGNTLLIRKGTFILTPVQMNIVVHGKVMFMNSLHGGHQNFSFSLSGLPLGFPLA